MVARALRAAAVGSLVLVVASCASVGDQILVVDNSVASDEARSIWAVEPGDELGDDRLVARDVVGPLNVMSRGRDGEVMRNLLGVAWQGELLLGTDTGDDDLVSAAQPGSKPTTIAKAPELETIAVPRGAFVFDERGCLLARHPEKAERVGAGNCAISDDDRWVVSWPQEGGPLKVRDLRSDEVRTVKGEFTQAAAMAHDARILAIEARGDEQVAKVIDATTGDVLGTTKPAEQMQVVPTVVGSEAFVVIAVQGDTPTLLWIDADGETTVVATGASGRPLRPVTVAGGVDYLSIDLETQRSELMHWSPGGEPEVLLEGDLTATAMSPDSLLVTRQIEVQTEGKTEPKTEDKTEDKTEPKTEPKTEGRLQFWSIHDGEIGEHPDYTLRLPTETSEHVSVGQVLSMGATAHVELLGPGGAYYVRVDTGGGDSSSAPLKGWEAARIAAIDRDGTVLLVGTKSPGDREERLLVVDPDGDEAAELARAAGFGGTLIREGIAYYTALSLDGGSAVWRLRASGSAPAAVGGRQPEKLWDKALIGGAAWETYGGASVTQTVDPVALINEAGQQP